MLKMNNEESINEINNKLDNIYGLLWVLESKLEILTEKGSI